MASERLGGGCLCGEVRYEIDRVFDSGYCHCSRCRKITGAPVVAWVHVEGDAFRVTRGTPREYVSSSAGNRCFCPHCGSALYFAGRDGRYFSVHNGTLDDPEVAPPQVHMCVETQLAWLELTDGLPRVVGNILPHPSQRGRV